jgi:hypothetical protein
MFLFDVILANRSGSCWAASRRARPLLAPTHVESTGHRPAVVFFLACGTPAASSPLSASRDHVRTRRPGSDQWPPVVCARSLGVEEASLGRVGREPDRGFVGGDRLVGPPGAQRSAPGPIVCGPGGEADHRAVGVEAVSSPRVGEQHDGKQAHGLGFVGQQLDEDSSERDRLVRQVRADEFLARCRGVALGEESAMADSTTWRPSGSSAAVGTPQTAWLSRSVRLARTSRCAMVVSGTQERPRALGRVEPADRSKRERDLRIR